MPAELSLAVSGAIHANAAASSNRQFEIATMSPGDPVRLVPEPRKKVDPSAVAVVSARGPQIGYHANADRTFYFVEPVSK